MADVTTPDKVHASLEMGMHTEALTGRSQQRFFDVSEASGRFGYPDAADVDFNKRAEIDCAAREPRDINLEIRSLIRQGFGTIVLNNPGAKHSLAVGILPVRLPTRHHPRNASHGGASKMQEVYR